jgi:radical SAM superfamily enzyme YgiQ (UPF0313 family)
MCPHDRSSSRNRLTILACKPCPVPQAVRVDRLVCCEPLELDYLYTAVHETDNVYLLDGMADKRDPVRLADRIGAQIVLLSAYVTDVDTVRRSAKRLKKLPDPPLVFVGGPHAEVVPEHFCTEGIDGVFFADQLQGLQIVISRIRDGQDYEDTPGAVFPVNGAFRRNPSVPLDVTALPVPSRILLDRSADRYRYTYYRPCASIKTSFGCPHRCAYCFCREMNCGAYTTRKISDVVEEIESIPVKNILIVDDNFLVGRNRLLRFCDEILDRGVTKEYIAYGTAHFVAHNADVMAELRAAGLTGLIVGFEFITDRELAAYDKRSTVLDNDRTLEVCRELDIELFALFMVDPDWQHDDFRGLARYLIENDIAFATFATITVLPGTELARQQGRIFDAQTLWWRYDLLRLHAHPRHMSPVVYYFWLFYLYMLSGLRLSSLRKLASRYGVWGLLRLLLDSSLTGLESMIKLLIWR